MLNVFGPNDGGCEDAMKQYAVWLNEMDDANGFTSGDERTIIFDAEQYNGGYSVLVNFKNNDEFVFIASDYKDMFYYMNAVIERSEYYYNVIYKAKHNGVARYVGSEIFGYLNIKGVC